MNVLAGNSKIPCIFLRVLEETTLVLALANQQTAYAEKGTTRVYPS